MNRQSVASSRASHLQSSQAPNPAAVARLMEKKKEFEAVSALERASALFLKRIEGLAEDCDVMADAGLVHGQVLAQWPHMFRTLNTFLASRERLDASTEDEIPASRAGDRLVRLPVEDLQGAES
ncbi:hypothetical protein K488DRAFT_52536 [Vararia minispora EC-137]|uniref:Uncharacterized protein n=1 Tax=Vararia minispora EC-137 TaxID=1314806 RepID=A0ACB8QHC0_9AGAM|nr:hypothetical protein K488DRAFT_52536 [Vararia minispora EC-137]